MKVGQAPIAASWDFLLGGAILELFRHGRAGQHLYANRYHPADRPLSQNGILIVEFARDYHKAGNPIRESALEAGHVRLASDPDDFIRIRLRGDALLFAAGAGAGSRLSLGAAVVFGMAVNTIFATMFIPSFYELMQLFQEKVLDKFSRKQK
ncbi:MAG: efflux RND transporter permease subunit [Parabacteroides merdae]